MSKKSKLIRRKGGKEGERARAISMEGLKSHNPFLLKAFHSKENTPVIFLTCCKREKQFHSIPAGSVQQLLEPSGRSSKNICDS